MKIVIPTYRDISWILPIYKFLHDKYWYLPFTVLGEESYIKDCEFGIPPCIDDEENVIYSDAFSNMLIWYLSRITDEFVAIMLSDYLITDKVNIRTINKMLEYMKTDDKILRCQLGSYSIAASEKTDSYKNVDIHEHGFLSTSLTPGIWNRKLLLNLLQYNWTAWDVEIKLNDIFLESDMRSICPIPEPINYINAIRGRRPNKMVMNEKLLADIKHLIPDNIGLHYETTY